MDPYKLTKTALAKILAAMAASAPPKPPWVQAEVQAGLECFTHVWIKSDITFPLPNAQPCKLIKPPLIPLACLIAAPVPGPPRWWGGYLVRVIRPPGQAIADQLADARRN